MEPRSISIYMTKDPKTVLTTTSLKETIQAFDVTNVSHLCVVDDKLELKGIISKQDVLNSLKKIVSVSPGKAYSQKTLASIKAKDLMTSEFVCLDVNDDIAYAIEWLLQNKFHCLPVTSENKLKGIVTSFDLLKSYYEHYG